MHPVDMYHELQNNRSELYNCFQRRFKFEGLEQLASLAKHLLHWLWPGTHDVFKSRGLKQSGPRVKENILELGQRASTVEIGLVTAKLVIV